MRNNVQLRFAAVIFCSYVIDRIRILGIELGLDCNRGSCGGIYLKIFACEKIPPQACSSVQACSSWSIVGFTLQASSKPFQVNP